MEIPELEGIIRAAVRAVGDSQAVLARRMNVTQSSVSRWVSGQAVPDFESCLALAEITGFPPEEVLIAAGHGVQLLDFVRRTAPEPAAPFVSARERIDAELSARLARLGVLLGRYPRAVWLAVIEANERMTDALDLALPEPPVSALGEGAFSASDRAQSGDSRREDGPLTNPYAPGALIPSFA